MIDAVCIILWIISGAGMLAYLGKPNRYRWFRPLAIFWLFYTIRVQLPSLYIYHEAGWAGMQGMANYPLAVAIAPLFVLFGAFLSGRRPVDAWPEWWRRPLTSRSNPAFAIWAIFGFGTLILLAHTLAAGGRIPVVALITHAGQADYLSKMRDEALKLLPLYVRYPVIWNRDLILPAAVLIAFLMLIVTRRGWARLLIVFFAAASQAAFTAARGPLAFLVVKCAVLYFMITHKKVRMLTIVIALILIMSFPFAVDMLKYGKELTLDNITRTWKSLFSRLFYTTSWTVGAHVSHVPDRTYGFLYGRSIGWYCRITAQTHYNLPHQVMQQYYRANPTAIANTCYVGGAWADFGWTGVVLFSVFVGWWLGTMESLLLRLPRTPVACAAAILATMQAYNLVSATLPNYMATFGGFGLMVVLLFLGSREKAYEQVAELPAGDTGERLSE